MSQKNETPNEILLRLYAKSGLSQRKLASLLGKNFDAMHGRIYRAQQLTDPNSEGISTEDYGNKKIVTSVSSRIVTVDDLISAACIDKDIWTIVKAKVNKWEGYRRQEIKDLEYIDGQPTGFIKDTGELTIEPLFQVRIEIAKKEPTALRPVISPVNVNISGFPKKKASKSNWKRALIIADPHFGFMRDLRTLELINFHDRRALSIILQIADDEEFDSIVLLGDVLDLADWSDKFLRSPEMYFCTQPAVVEASWFIGQIRRTFGGDFYVIEGNHDERMKRSIKAHFINAYDLRAADRMDEEPPVSIPALLGLSRMGVKYVGDYPKGRVKLNKHVVLKHGDVARGASGGTAKAVLDKAAHTTGFGHIHRFEHLTKTYWDGEDYRYIQSFSTGCLCKIDGTVPGSKVDADWQQGFSVMNYCENGDHHLEEYPIEGGRVFYKGKIYEEENYVGDLMNQTGFNF